MDELVGHASYYLLGWLLLSAGFGSVKTDSSSHCIRQSLFAVDLPRPYSTAAVAAAAASELNVATALPNLNK